MVTQLLYTYETTEDALLLYYLVKKIETKLICNSANNIRCNIVCQGLQKPQRAHLQNATNLWASILAQTPPSLPTYLLQSAPVKVWNDIKPTFLVRNSYDEKKKKQLRCQPYQVRDRVTNSFLQSCNFSTTYLNNSLAEYLLLFHKHKVIV